MNKYHLLLVIFGANLALMLSIVGAVWLSARRVGTKSLLFGVHQLAWHPFTVTLAWRKLYGVWPTWREFVCILVHDVGYWGCRSMDGVDGEWHPRVGAKIASRLFGHTYYDFVLLHSRYLAKSLDMVPSKLCWADKFSMIYDPQWFYLLRARLSGEIGEYRRKAAARGFIALHATDAEWHAKLVEHLKAIALEKSKEFQPKKPHLFYFNSHRDCWLPFPKGVRGTKAVVASLKHDEIHTTVIRRVDMTDAELAALPEV